MEKFGKFDNKKTICVRILVFQQLSLYKKKIETFFE